MITKYSAHFRRLTRIIFNKIVCKDYKIKNNYKTTKNMTNPIYNYKLKLYVKLKRRLIKRNFNFFNVN